MKSSSNTPRYDLSFNPPYQINYRAKRAGKHISASKRRITFQFGFSSASAIKAGATEVQCRGEEHEVVLIWSHMTGKRQLYMDGREIHMSKAARGNTKFEYSWSISGNHVMKIIANGTPPMGEMAKCHRQFDLELDGMSFFTFSRIYELGKNVKTPSAVERREDNSHALTPTEDAPKTYSYRGMTYDERDDDYEDEVPMSEVKVTSIDLFDSSPPHIPSMISPMTHQSESMPSLAASSSTSSYDEFTPVQQTLSPTAYQKSFDSISNEILCAYATNNNAPAPSDVSNQSSSRALVPVSEEGMDVITKSMKNLVNLDDITTEPLQPLSKTSMKKPSNNSWGQHVGRAPTLQEMRGKAESPTMSTQPREVMKSHPPPPQGYYQPQQQAMVAFGGYHQQQQQHPPQQMMYQQQYGAPNMGYAPAY